MVSGDSEELEVMIECILDFYQRKAIDLKEYEVAYVEHANKVVGEKGTLSEKRTLIVKDIYCRCAYPLLLEV